jgi:hypothetical protein
MVTTGEPPLAVEAEAVAVEVTMPTGGWYSVNVEVPEIVEHVRKKWYGVLTASVGPVKTGDAPAFQ